MGWGGPRPEQTSSQSHSHMWTCECFTFQCVPPYRVCVCVFVTSKMDADFSDITVVFTDHALPGLWGPQRPRVLQDHDPRLRNDGSAQQHEMCRLFFTPQRRDLLLLLTRLLLLGLVILDSRDGPTLPFLQGHSPHAV